MTVDVSEFLRPAKPSSCKFGRILTEVTDEQREKLEAVVPLKEVTNDRIVQVVCGWGFPIGSTVVRRHRQGTCACD